MKWHRFPSSLRFLFLFSLLIISGCSKPILKMAETLPPIVKEYKHMTLYGQTPGMQNTRIHLNKGQPYSILATGSIYMNSKYPNVRPQDGWPLMARLGKSRYSRPLYGSKGGVITSAAHSGTLYLGIRRGTVNPYGEPDNPEYYRYSTGSFNVDIIVWESEDYVQIADFLETMKGKNPKNEAISDALNLAEIFKPIYLASQKASQEIEETKKELQELKQEPEQEKKQAAKVTPKEKPSLQTKPSPATEEKQERIVLLEAKLTKLTETLTQLEEMRRQLEEERKKTDLLTKELAEKDQREKDLLTQLDHGPKTHPVIVIASPKDACDVEASTVTVSGVVEDDRGVERMEILINDKLLETQIDRGIMVEGDKYPRRLDFRERITLENGENRITIRAFDSDGLSAEKILTVHKREIRKNVWAVVIGINTYPNVRQLNCAVNDAQAFYQHLVHYNNIPPENVTLLINQEANLTKLRSTLGTHLKNKAGREDMVIIYFAGHGATERDMMSPDGDGLEKYLLPYGADPKDLYASALPMREISHIFHRIQSERLVFIVDSCYSGASGGRTVSLTGIRASLSDAFLDRIAGGKGRIILTASGANEVSSENEELHHGIFTYYLLEGLRGKADTDGDGLITVDEVYGYVSKHVPQATGQEQHPVKKGTVEGRLILGVID